METEEILFVITLIMIIIILATILYVFEDKGDPKE